METNAVFFTFVIISSCETAVVNNYLSFRCILQSQSQGSEMKYDEARRSANIARILTLVTICCGIGGYIILIAVTATK